MTFEAYLANVTNARVLFSHSPPIDMLACEIVPGRPVFGTFNEQWLDDQALTRKKTIQKDVLYNGANIIGQASLL